MWVFLFLLWLFDEWRFAGRAVRMLGVAGKEGASVSLLISLLLDLSFQIEPGWRLLATLHSQPACHARIASCSTCARC